MSRDVRRHLAAQATVIAALMRRLGLDEATLEQDEIDAAEGEIAVDVDRDSRGDMTWLRVRRLP